MEHLCSLITDTRDIEMNTLILISRPVFGYMMGVYGVVLVAISFSQDGFS